MTRSGYREGEPEDQEEMLAMWRYRGQVASAIRGKRGQQLLIEMAEGMDAMQEKVLIHHRLIDDDGHCCALGVVCKSRGLDISNVDENDSSEVGRALNIASQLAAEIASENDDDFDYHKESPEQRWVRMRAWVENHLRSEEQNPCS